MKATPALVSPLAGALSQRLGLRLIMFTGLSLQALAFTWVALRDSLGTSWVEVTVALFVGGVGISMALPTVPTAVLNAVAPDEMGKASGISYMAQRFGAVFAIAIGSAVFSARGGLAAPASVHAGFAAATWVLVAFAVLAAVTALGVAAPRRADSSAGEEPAIASAAA